MQIIIEFTCRECGRNSDWTWDTVGRVVNGRAGDPPGVVQLTCRRPGCGHTSGELELTYTYRAEHRPTWERNPS